MGRRLPPFTAVRSFEAAARHLSFKSAADELCVTPSAVSHQVRLLEEYLDTSLFDRDGNRLTLTLTGKAYVGKLTGLLNALEESTVAVSNSDRQELRILSTPGFAARWLVPRLGRLSFGNDIRLRVSEGAPSTDFAHNDADVVIMWSDVPVQGVVVLPLMATGRFPVISPELQRSENIQRPEDLLRVTLFHDEVQDGWAEWFDAAGVEKPDFPRGPRFANCELSTTAAEQGQGVALAYGAVAQGTLDSGRLVRLFDIGTTPVTIYSVAVASSRAHEPRIRDFCNWIFNEVKAVDALADKPQKIAQEASV